MKELTACSDSEIDKEDTDLAAGDFDKKMPRFMQLIAGLELTGFYDAQPFATGQEQDMAEKTKKDRRKFLQECVYAYDNLETEDKEDQEHVDKEIVQRLLGQVDETHYRKMNDRKKRKDDL